MARSVGLWLAGCCVLLIAGCAAGPVAPYAGVTNRISKPRAAGFDLIVAGHHSELALPVDAVSGRLAVFIKRRAGVRYLVFGWGERRFYMARRPGVWATLRAGFPSPSVLLVSPLNAAPRRVFAADTQIFALRVSPAGIARLERYIWRYVTVDRDGRPRPLKPAPARSGRFYAANGTYDLLHTCNTWSAEALRAAGEPISADGVVLASQLVRRPRRVRTTASAGSPSAVKVVGQ